MLQRMFAWWHKMTARILEERIKKSGG